MGTFGIQAPVLPTPGPFLSSQRPQHGSTGTPQWTGHGAAAQDPATHCPPGHLQRTSSALRYHWVNCGQSATLDTDHRPQLNCPSHHNQVLPSYNQSTAAIASTSTLFLPTQTIFFASRPVNSTHTIFCCQTKSQPLLLSCSPPPPPPPHTTHNQPQHNITTAAPYKLQIWPGILVSGLRLLDCLTLH